jgi:TRAP-type mannitol/chloroaromatic compound transport system permease large subunit
VIPLFVLMGAFIHRSQLAQDLYDAANAFVGHRRGGLAMGTIAACGGFGGGLRVVAGHGGHDFKVAMPSMRRFGYADRLSTGSIAAGGTLGILIPPSVPMVIYGLLSETDIAKLFIAGILPGLLLIVLFFGAIAFTTWRDPQGWSARPCGCLGDARAVAGAGLGGGADFCHHHRRHLCRHLHPDRGRRHRRAAAACSPGLARQAGPAGPCAKAWWKPASPPA